MMTHHNSSITILVTYYIGRRHRKYIDLNLKPFRGNNNINNYIFHTKKNVQFKTSNKYLLLLLLLLINSMTAMTNTPRPSPPPLTACQGVTPLLF